MVSNIEFRGSIPFYLILMKNEATNSNDAIFWRKFDLLGIPIKQYLNIWYVTYVKYVTYQSNINKILDFQDSLNNGKNWMLSNVYIPTVSSPHK